MPDADLVMPSDGPKKLITVSPFGMLLKNSSMKSLPSNMTLTGGTAIGNGTSFSPHKPRNLSQLKML